MILLLGRRWSANSRSVYKKKNKSTTPYRRKWQLLYGLLLAMVETVNPFVYDEQKEKTIFC